MLPSTFQDSLKKEELMKNELKARVAVAGVLQASHRARLIPLSLFTRRSRVVAFTARGQPTFQ